MLHPLRAHQEAQAAAAAVAAAARVNLASPDAPPSNGSSTEFGGSGSSNNSGAATPVMNSRDGQHSSSNGHVGGVSIPIPVPSTSGTSFKRHRLESGQTYDGLQLSPGPGQFELGSSYKDGVSPFGLASSYNDTLAGLQSFMSLNAPASPKRLSALELTFPSLEAYGYSDSDEDDYDPGPYGMSNPRRGRPRRRNPSAAGSRDPSTDSSTASRSPASIGGGGRKHLRQRHSSFAEYGDKPPPTSLAILAGLISGSARIIDRAYAEQGLPVPDIDDPGLPKSRYSKDPTELKITTEIYKAIEVCIEACHQLVGIVQRPEVTAAEAAYAFELSAALKVTTEHHVVEVLREEGSRGMHIINLAERVGMEPMYLLRIMRLLTAHNVFLEMGSGSQWFANNRVSLRIDSKEPLDKVMSDTPYESPDGPRVEIRSLVSHATDFTWHSASQMEERLQGKEITQIQATHPDEARALLYRQLNARKCASYLGDPPNLINVFRSLGNGLVVDLGSGLGRDLLGVARVYPSLRIELHDKPETMALAKEMWFRLAPRSVITKAVSFVPHDLLGPAKYPKASTYLMRNHLVHWGDSDALTILSKARASAFNSSRLFVEESTSDDELPQDASFLPPELAEMLEPVLQETSHNADRIQHLLDVAALLSGNGRKRNIIELVLLFEKAGWRCEKVDNSSGGRCKIFICRPIKKVDPDE